MIARVLWLPIALLAVLAAFGLACGDDDDDDDDNNDDNNNDDNNNTDDDDDDDNNDDTPAYYGPVNISESGEPEYFYADWRDEGTWPEQHTLYHVEVRPLAEKSPAWTNDYDLLNGTYTFALGDLDQDGAYEIIETATYNYPYAGQATVRDGQEDFAIVFDSGLAEDVTLWSEPDWDIDADGQAELMIKANPSFGTGARGWVRWFEAADDYNQVKNLQGGADHYVDVLAGSVGGRRTPVAISAPGEAEYLYIETYFTGEAPYYTYNYDLEVRRGTNDAAVWSQSYSLDDGYMIFGVADLDDDGVLEIIEIINFTDTGKAAGGRVDVRDGDEGFAAVFDTQEVSGVVLYATGAYDMNRNGAAELFVTAEPILGGDTAGWLRWYEGAADYAPVDEIIVPAGRAVDFYPRVEDGFWGPVDLDGDEGGETLLVEWYAEGEPPNETHHYDLRVLNADGGAPAWTHSYDLAGTMAFSLSDLDADGTYEILEAFNYLTYSAIAEAAQYQGKVTVRDGHAGFAVVFNTQILDDVFLYAAGDWDMNRDLWPELAVRSQAEPGSSAEYWRRWHQGIDDYALIKSLTAPAGSAGLTVLGAYR